MSFGVMDSPASAPLDALVEATSHQFGAPICAVSLIDGNRQWMKAKVGIDIRETPREIAFCDHAIRQNDIFVVEDATLDDRFKDNILVSGEPHIRFYAGVPLAIRDGVAIGTLCIIDRQPRSLDERERKALKTLATVAMGLLESYRLAEAGRLLDTDAQHQRSLAEDRSRALLLRERQFAQAGHVAGVGIWELDVVTNALVWSPEVYRIHEVEAGTVMSTDLALDFYPQRERQKIVACLVKALQSGKTFDDEFRIVAASGSTKWVRVAGEAEFVGGSAQRLFGIIQDISERHTAEADLWRAAHHDALTGLANRAHFAARLAGVFSPSADSGQTGTGLLVVDVDNLKEVNDTLGHEAGDHLLKTISDRIAAIAEGEAIVARIGGDDFAVLSSEPVGAPRLEALAASILQAVRPEIRYHGETMQPRLSIGGAVAGDGDTPETLRQKASLALSKSKSETRGGYTAFHDDMRSAALRRFGMLRNVEDAITEGRLHTHYQPIVSLTDRGIVSFEALARIKLPDGRILAAGAFQEAFREPRIAHRLTTVMLETIARDLRAWLDFGFPPFSVAINVTTADFKAGDLRDRIIDIFGRMRVPLRQLAIEVTETVFLNGNEQAVLQTIEALRADGVVVALDDFGTGFASLTHLKSLPVDIIKVDKSFVDGMMAEETSLAIVETLIGLARRLGLKIVAEGVETDAQAERLAAMDCSLAQGYLFARPADAATIVALMLAAGTGHARPLRPRLQRARIAG